ncbi:MAG: SRPBCC family protein [Thermomicrobiales bacterium]
MAEITIATQRAIPAPAEAVYSLLADYHHDHPSILPPAFRDLTVLSGGTGEGTVFRIRMTLGGRSQVATMRVAEPEPGRVLSESDPESGILTLFVVTPHHHASLLQITTTIRPRRGPRGWIEGLLIPRLLRPVYEEELDNIVRWADQQNQV